MPDPPQGPPSTRRLCAVLLADVTGFSRLMGDDEPRAIAVLSRVREVFTAVVPLHHGTLDVFVGDCFVALFGSAVDAVQAAAEIQTQLVSVPGPAGDPIRIRIGIHLGEVVRDGSEVFGDSINIASRLQTIARPGGVTLSEDVYRAVRNRVTVTLRDAGVKQLKNIRDPMRVYEVDIPGVSDTGRSGGGGGTSPRAHILGAFGLILIAGLGLAAWQLTGRSARIVPSGRTLTRPSRENPLIVGVTGIAARGDVPDWMREVTRDGLNTILSKVQGLSVYSRQKIDFLREKRGLSELEAAETLGITKMISGSLAKEANDTVVLEVQVVDIGTGFLDASERVDGRTEELIELQNRLAAALLDGLHVPLSVQQKQALFAKRTNDTLDAYRMLADTFGGAPEDAPPEGSELPPGTSWLAWPGVAHAADGADDAAIRTVLEAYRGALEAKDLDRLGAHLEMTDAQKSAFARYFENASNLKITVADVDVLIEGDEALATFTRRDTFVDGRSGKEVQLEVRLSSVLKRQGGAWKIASVKKA